MNVNVVDTNGHHEQINQLHALIVDLHTGIRRERMSNKHVITNVIRTGYKLVSVIYSCDRGYGMSSYYLKHPEETPGYKLKGE